MEVHKKALEEADNQVKGLEELNKSQKSQENDSQRLSEELK